MNPRPVPEYRLAKHTARSLALQVLLDCQHQAGSGTGFVQEHLDQRLIQHPLESADRRLTTQLVYGVLRRRGTLHALLRPLLSRPPDQVEKWLDDVLCLGAFQLVLLTQIPVHAALNETVELAVSYGRPDARGFINGVLRALSRRVTSDRTDKPGADAVPLADGDYRRLTQDVLPDPQRHAVPYLACAFGLPPWLVERWLQRHGNAECSRLGFWFASAPPLFLRCNPTRIDRAGFLLHLDQAGIKAAPGSHPQAVHVLDLLPIAAIPGYAEGWFCVQDESAMAVASALAPQPGSRVLDLCAAPGGKTTHLAELMQGQGEIIACDVSEKRLQTVAALANRLGAALIQTRQVVADDPGSLPTGTFDFVLVDVPCSNTGVLGRRPEVRERLHPNDLRYLVPIQQQLLTAGLERTRKGGSLVYSTCSIEPEENGELVRGLLRGRNDVTLEAEQEAIPGQPADGGYWAKLRRR
jgi:16S rRNA (cytosine967-C5)-methyltransferase